MHVREIGRERPKTLPIKKREKDLLQIKWIRFCREMGNGRERKPWACPGVVEAEQLIGQWAPLRRCSQQIKMIGKQ